MICENCNIEHDGQFATSRFCSSKCARSFSTKNKRKEINEKVSKKLRLDRTEKKCEYCNNLFYVTNCGLDRKYCTKKCSDKVIRQHTLESKIKMSIKSKDRCSSLEEKERMKLIGRKGGYGKKGYTTSGIYYQSTLEEKCFNLLTSRNIKFEAHKNLPISAKETDIYLTDKDIWIELDGIDREYRKKYLGDNYQRWLDKIAEYKDKNLKMLIFKKFAEFENYINETFAGNA